MSAGAASTPRDSAVPVRTTRFGRLETVEVRPDALLAFPSGLPGFEDQTSFALIDDPRHHPFRWLQSLADSAVRFLVIEAGLVASGGRLELGGADLDALRLRPDERPEVLCILTLAANSGSLAANLRAPLVLNRRLGRGRQVILADDRLSLRHPLVPADRGPAKRPGLSRCSS